MQFCWIDVAQLLYWMERTHPESSLICMTVSVRPATSPKQHIGIILENFNSSNEEFVSWYNCRTATLCLQSPQSKFTEAWPILWLFPEHIELSSNLLPRCGYDSKGGCKLRWRGKGNALCNCTHAFTHSFNLIFRHHNRALQTVFKINKSGFESFQTHSLLSSKLKKGPRQQETALPLQPV